MTVANFVSKTAHFILTHTTNCHYRWYSKIISALYMETPYCIVLDKGLQFVMLFTKELYCLLRVEIAYFMAWYPQWNRQTEWIN